MAAEMMIRGGGASSSPPALILTSGASGRIRAIFSPRALRSLLTLIYAFVLILILPFRGRRRASSSEKKDNRDEMMKQEIIICGGGSSSSSSSSSSSQQKLRKGSSTVVMRVPSAMVSWRRAAAMDHEVAARRALSIKRVLEEEEKCCLVRDFSLFVTARGDTVFTQSWAPPSSVKIRGLVIILHGLNEHSGRYSDFAKQLNSYGYKVYGMDWIGHGGSDGLHAYVPSLDYAVSDTKSFIEKVVAENHGLPCFCFGHSTGGAILLKAMLDPKVEANVAGLVLTSPAVGVQPSHPIFAILAPIVSFLLPRYQVSAANKKGTPVSRDPEALEAKYSDPLVYTGSIRVRTGYEILKITSYLQQNLNKLRVPFLVLHGKADTITDPEASKKLYEEASSVDKEIKLFDGLLHDLLFEPERQEIMEDIIEWLNQRVEKF
ncbi:hypothetical protein CsatA_000071 [Cannabis sativa]